jgi:hypothetical protein
MSSDPFAPGSPERAMFDQLRVFGVRHNDQARAELVVLAARRNPGLTQWDDVRRYGVRTSGGDLDRLAAILASCCGTTAKWAAAAGDEERLDAARQIVADEQAHIVADENPLPNAGSGLGYAPDHCSPSNPYGWKRLPRPGEDHSDPGNPKLNIGFNEYRATWNGPFGEHVTEITNPDHDSFSRSMTENSSSVDSSEQAWLKEWGVTPTDRCPHGADTYHGNDWCVTCARGECRHGRMATVCEFCDGTKAWPTRNPGWGSVPVYGEDPDLPPADAFDIDLETPQTRGSEEERGSR